MWGTLAQIANDDSSLKASYETKDYLINPAFLGKAMPPQRISFYLNKGLFSK